MDRARALLVRIRSGGEAPATAEARATVGALPGEAIEGAVFLGEGGALPPFPLPRTATPSSA
eukprot:7725520-Alexandrium_andersonii.AAC.1